MTAPEHVIRPRKAGWRCSCGDLFSRNDTAEAHAWATKGRLELGRSA